MKCDAIARKRQSCKHTGAQMYCGFWLCGSHLRLIAWTYWDGPKSGAQGLTAEGESSTP